MTCTAPPQRLCDPPPCPTLTGPPCLFPTRAMARRRRNGRWRPKAGQPLRPPLALVYQWCASSCIRALDAYGRADVNWRIASRAEEDAWNKYHGAYLWGAHRVRHIANTLRSLPGLKLLSVTVVTKHMMPTGRVSARALACLAPALGCARDHEQCWKTCKCRAGQSSFMRTNRTQLQMRGRTGPGSTLFSHSETAHGLAGIQAGNQFCPQGSCRQTQW